MSGTSQHNAIYFPEGAGYLLVKVLQTKLDSYDVESDVILVRTLDDNKLYIRKIVELSEKSFSGIPNEIEFNLSFRLIPRVKDITKYIQSSGEYYWAICTDHCNGGDVRGLFQMYATEKGVQISEGLIWKFIADMIKIIRFLHEHRICHRDIGPRNIFMRYPHDDDSWPDFVLGDFGWAIPMQEDNCSVDRWLFLSTLFDLCTGMEEDDGTTDSHLSLEMCWSVKDLYDMLQKPSVDSLQYLTKKLLPLGESKVRKFRNLTVRPAATESSTTCKTHNNGKAWPAKIEGVLEDWQVVNITESFDGSCKVTIQGLAKSTRDGTRSFSGFIRSASGSMDLDLIHRFDADGMSLPPLRLISEGAFTRMTFKQAIKMLAEEDQEEKEGAKADEGAPRKKRRLSPEHAQLAELEPTDIDAGHPLLSEAIPRMSRPTAEIAKDDLPKVDAEHSGQMPSGAIDDVCLVIKGCMLSAVFVLALSFLMISVV